MSVSENRSNWVAVVLMLIALLFVAGMFFLCLKKGESQVLYTNADLKSYERSQPVKSGVLNNFDLIKYKSEYDKREYDYPWMNEQEQPAPVYDSPIRIKDEQSYSDQVGNYVFSRIMALQVRFCTLDFSRGYSVPTCGYKLRYDGQPLTGYQLTERGRYWQ
jgi:hypothetical protein